MWSWLNFGRKHAANQNGTDGWGVASKGSYAKGGKGGIGKNGRGGNGGNAVAIGKGSAIGGKGGDAT